MDCTNFTELCHYLTPEERLKIFDMLCGKLGKRLPERVWLATNMHIPRTHVYRYLDRPGKKRTVPSPETTARIIDALIYRGGQQEVLNAMKPALKRMIGFAKLYAFRMSTLGCNISFLHLDKNERKRLDENIDREVVGAILREEETF